MSPELLLEIKAKNNWLKAEHEDILFPIGLRFIGNRTVFNLDNGYGISIAKLVGQRDLEICIFRVVNGKRFILEETIEDIKSYAKFEEVLKEAIKL